ncbi:TetR/AcrR family transcriptional regulator [Gordonia neofelifaecis]|nr:TetR/AcrR family transcriptional regulator [Gordonia neofelifaecis]
MTENGGVAQRADWMRDTRRSAVQDRIVEIAGDVFAERGADASMADIAAAVGCSRATLYRYFDGRRTLQLEYIGRVARRIGAAVEAAVAGEADPAVRLTEAVVVALDQVRREPALAAWFTPGGAGSTSELALSSEFVETAATTFLSVGGRPGQDAARWVIRVIVSLLVVPGGSPADERAMIATFVTPSVLASLTTT